MAGRLTISTLNDDTGVLATQNGMSGIAKAWINFNGLSNASRGSFNVSSITDNGTGNYTLNFITAMPDVNYSVVGSIGSNGTYSGWCFVPFSNNTVVVDPTTSAVRFSTVVATIGVVDSPYVTVAVFR